MFRHRVPRLNHRRRRSTPVNHCLAVKVGGRKCGVAVLSVNFLFLGVAPRGTMHAALRDHHRSTGKHESERRDKLFGLK